ncbi:MAG: nitrogen regulatory protein PII [Cryomorphaceae bacterium]|jgi:nitrogen regulatory protein PII
MTNEKAKLLTIITETALESSLIDEIETLGAPGYTITNARGKGHRGSRNASWEANSNIRIEIIASAAVIQKIIEHIQNKYYDHYAMVSFTSEIEVLRSEKFTK